ncbi:M48 family metallopeptidase [Streptomyces sp. NPDC008150]|uniref:M48 family metallopeptidase n=1 Tax=Streptomyces sp. NPDC008150 TaxID=3364816 RepID=UPI0036EB09A1
MGTGVGEVVRNCPQCGAGIRADARFTAWCAACDWNVDPVGPAEQRPGRMEKVRRALARRHGESLFAEALAGGTLRPGRDASLALAHAIALAVHGVTLALAALGGWLVVSHPWGVVGPGFGVLLLALAWVLRPRRARWPTDRPVLGRAEAPELFALIDAVADAVGSRGVDAVALGPEFNAGIGTLGVRGRRVLFLGVPLWEATTPQQRIAVLSHELGFHKKGNARHRLPASAFHTLLVWRGHLLPDGEPSDWLEVLQNLVCLVPCLFVHGVLVTLRHLTVRDVQRAVYFGDRESARVASTEAAAQLLGLVLVAGSLTGFLHRETNRAALRGPGAAREAETRSDELWEAFVAHTASVPEHEYERCRRVELRRGHSLDLTHPSAALRQELLLRSGPLRAVVVADDGRHRLIAAELAGARRTIGRRILSEGYLK